MEGLLAESLQSNGVSGQQACRQGARISHRLATIMINTYRQDPEFYIGGETIYSSEGMTQGDLLAMAMFALAMLPLIDKMNGGVRQIWYADDASAGSKLVGLRAWWDKVTQLGPEYGYYAKPAKTLLVVKEGHL